MACLPNGHSDTSLHPFPHSNLNFGLSQGCLYQSYSPNLCQLHERSVPRLAPSSHFKKLRLPTNFEFCSFVCLARGKFKSTLSPFIRNLCFRPISQEIKFSRSLVTPWSCPIFTLTHTAITPRLTTLTLYIYMV